MERVDVAIVGGGPGGLAAGLTAADAGADAVVLEKGVPRADREALGPDSTDAAGMLDYWVDLMDEEPAAIPEDVILQELEASEFVGPTERCRIDRTGIASSWDGFGFAFDRVAMDDWWRERAEGAGADYRVGTAVRGVEHDGGEHEGANHGQGTGHGVEHVVRTADGEDLRADALILADGPQRTITGTVLERFLPEGVYENRLSSRMANHVAYQEHRRFPAELFDPDTLRFWWGLIPGETAYPWIFPNDDGIARVGLTMPMDIDIDAVEDREDYALLEPEDDSIPPGSVYLRRLLEREYPGYDVESDFPLVEDRGKRGGTEAYAISSTRPIHSPVEANVAVVGGAMGTTSAFHEGELAANGDLAGYNAAWEDAIGTEILRNVTFADVVSEYGPADWDRTFRIVRDLVEGSSGALADWRLSSGLAGLGAVAQYKWRKWAIRRAGYVQIHETEYTV
jgi:electron-transferring-flavoprotein dehydrogenase